MFNQYIKAELVLSHQKMTLEVIKVVGINVINVFHC